MASSTKQKYRAIEILRILTEESDRDNPITTQDFCERLGKRGFSCDRRTLSEDIAGLVDLGYKISKKPVSKQLGYFYDGFLFTADELKVLIDAVQASSFIPEKRTSVLMDKLSTLAGCHKEEVLKGNMVTFNTRKHVDEDIMNNVGAINRCISAHKKISFQYYDLDENKKKRLRKSRKRYVENPVALVYNDDNYYLVCYSDKYQNKVVYRVDRMYLIVKTDEEIVPEADCLKEELPTYTKQAFRMFGGDTEKVKLQFDRTLLGQIFDQFGEETVARAIADDWLETTVDVQVSPTFFGWLTQFGNKMIVVEPKTVRNNMSTIVNKLRKAYNDQTADSL